MIENVLPHPQTLNDADFRTARPASLEGFLLGHIVNFIKEQRVLGHAVVGSLLILWRYGKYGEAVQVRGIEPPFRPMGKGLVYMKTVKSGRSRYGPHF